MRIIEYAGRSRLDGGKEHIMDSGYVASFESLIDYIYALLPNNEYIGLALRMQTEMFPRIAIRELAANGIIHQDFDVRGDSPVVEVFSDRIEIANSGLPLIDTLRFIDEPSQSRNGIFVDFLRRVNICEERGAALIKQLDLWKFFNFLLQNLW